MSKQEALKEIKETVYAKIEREVEEGDTWRHSHYLLPYLLLQLMDKFDEVNGNIIDVESAIRCREV